MQRQSAKIGLVHHVGGGNLGDDATLDVVVHNIKRRWPHAVMVAFSMNPADTRDRHGIPSYPLRAKTWAFGYQPPRGVTGFKAALKTLASKHSLPSRLLRAANAVAIRGPKGLFREASFLAASARAMRSVDLLIISGGGQLTEWGGPWGFPYTIFKWVFLARCLRVRCLFWNVGAGPLSHPLSRFFVVRALLSADYVSFRDRESRDLVQQIGFTRENHVCPDTAYSLEVASPEAGSFRTRRQPVVGLAPMPYCDPRVYPAEKNQFVYDQMIRKLAVFASWLLERSHSLELFGTDIGVDPLAIADLQIALRDRQHIDSPHYGVHDSVKSLDALLAAMSGMDYVITCRYHGVIFAHLLNKPVLALAHHPKVANIMSDLGLSAYCVDLRGFDVNALMDRFAALVRNADEIRSRMKTSLAIYRQRLAAQFDSVFPQSSPL